jgi:hypothetical protein
VGGRRIRADPGRCFCLDHPPPRAFRA